MQLKRFYDGLDDDLRALLSAQVRNLWTHASTAIEGNSLSLAETALVLGEGLTVAGKPLKDHQEVFGHARAIDLMSAMLDRDDIGERDVFLLHRAVLADRVADVLRPAGAWKAEEAGLAHGAGPDGRRFAREYPAPERVAGLMAEWLERLDRALREPGLDEGAALAQYAALHLSFVSVHPFFDGNGRMARLLCNLPVLRSGLPPLVVPTALRREYRGAIFEYQAGIADLAALRSLDELPRNGAAAAFEKLCRSFAREPLELVENFRALQKKRQKPGEASRP